MAITKGPQDDPSVAMAITKCVDILHAHLFLLEIVNNKQVFQIHTNMFFIVTILLK